MPLAGTEMEEFMSVNGVTNVGTDAYSTYTAGTNTKKADVNEKTTAEAAASESTSATAENSAVYEPSKKTAETSATKKTYKSDPKLVAKLKADAEARTSQLRSLVEKMMTKQANTYGNANDIWKFLAKGDFTVDPATKAQAQADIAEDGYWGVEQTSGRIIDFATALTGGDPDKIAEMRDAFLKGYKQAEKTWGGNLPDISKRTYDAVLSKFDEMAKNAGVELSEINGND